MAEENLRPSPGQLSLYGASPVGGFAAPPISLVETSTASFLSQQSTMLRKDCFIDVLAVFPGNHFAICKQSFGRQLLSFFFFFLLQRFIWNLPQRGKL